MRFLSILTVAIGSVLCNPVFAQFSSSPPLAEELFLQNNLVVILTPAGSGTGSIIGHRDGAYYVLTSKHVVSGIAKGEEIEIKTGSGESYPASVAVMGKKLDLAVVRFSAKNCYPTAYIGVESALWAKQMSPQLQPNRMIVAGLSNVDPSISKKPILRSSIANLAVRISQEDSVNGYQYGYDAPTSRGMSGGGLFTDAKSVTAGRTCMGQCNQPYGYHLGVHGRGERDGARGDAKTGYNFAIPSVYVLPLLASADLLDSLNTNILYVRDLEPGDAKITDLAESGFPENNGFKLDMKACKPHGLKPVTFNNNSDTNALLKSMNKLFEGKR